MAVEIMLRLSIMRWGSSFDAPRNIFVIWTEYFGYRFQSYDMTFSVITWSCKLWIISSIELLHLVAFNLILLYFRAWTRHWVPDEMHVKFLKLQKWATTERWELTQRMLFCLFWEVHGAWCLNSAWDVKLHVCSSQNAVLYFYYTSSK
jgi:hypothetical protein